MQFTGADPVPFRHVLSAIGLDVAAVGGSIHVAGDDPVIASPHRLALASASLLAAQGAATAALWRHRGGGEQRIDVDCGDAILALNPLVALRRAGHAGFHYDDRTAPLNNFFRAGDGRWLFLTGVSPRLRDGTLRLLKCWNDVPAIADAVAKWNSFELEEALAAARLTGSVVRTPAEWRDHPHGRHLAGKPLVEIEKIGDAPRRTFETAPRPMSGLRTIDMTHVLAGPTTARAMAEQGADVLRLTSMRPDLADAEGVMIEMGMGKRSAVIDLNLAEDRDTLAQLCAGADVFAQSWRPGLLARHGFAPEQVAARRPGIIYVSITCFGLDGPWGGRGGYDVIALNATGFTAEESAVDAPRFAPCGIVTDHMAGFLGGAAVASTLLRQAREGGSYHIKISLAQIAMWVQSLGLVTVDGVPMPPVPRMERIESPYGPLEYLASPIRYTETPAWFERPPAPEGSSPPVWLQGERDAISGGG